MSSSVQPLEPVGGPDPGLGSVDPAAKPVRRSFTAEYRSRVVAEYVLKPTPDAVDRGCHRHRRC